jgi:hypothetical protein
MLYSFRRLSNYFRKKNVCAPIEFPLVRVKVHSQDHFLLGTYFFLSNRYSCILILFPTNLILFSLAFATL